MTMANTDSVEAREPPLEASIESAARAYTEKPAAYFANARHDIVALLGTGPASAIIELGCGAGGTGRAAIAAGKARRYVGIELHPSAASLAASALSEVLVGNVEEMDLSGLTGQFDALIISEVLEHLVDPWRTLERLAQCVKPDGELYASSPNIAHFDVIGKLLMGRFQYTGSGVMDWTHLRWFTPQSYRELCEAAGFDVLGVRPLNPPGWKARLLDAATAGHFSHLFMRQIMLVGRRRQPSSP